MNNGKKYRHYQMLTREEEIAAWERGDHNALVESVWPFVIRTVGKFAHESETLFDDLLSEAGLSLARSLQTYDATQTRFITYGCKYIYAHLAGCVKQYREQRFCELPDYATPSVEDTLTLAMVDDPQDDATKAAKKCEQVVVELRDVLTPNEHEVIQRRMRGETYREIAEQNGYARQRAQQLFRSARGKARKHLPFLVESEA